MRETWSQHQSRFAQWALALAQCGEVEPQFDAQDRLAELWLGECAEAQRFHFVFSDCP